MVKFHLLKIKKNKKYALKVLHKYNFFDYFNPFINEIQPIIETNFKSIIGFGSLSLNNFEDEQKYQTIFM